MKNVTVVRHPLVQVNLTRLRNAKTPMQEFRRALAELAALMVYEATRDIDAKPVPVRTPLQKTTGAALKREIILVPVLRAGLGLVDAILRVIPQAQVGFIGCRRNEETLEITTYYQNLPKKLGSYEVILLDPMLATGGSTIAAMTLLAGRGARHVRMINVLAAPEGIREVHGKFKSLPIFTAAIDDHINEHGFIVPGLGDAGDRLFGA
ncbi:MAG: uracil phosphoribosyltransferase [Opitutaceae bacterium]|nr:uracil phosphoribosyltransferase [Verrucomicrobiales bacterium]